MPSPTQTMTLDEFHAEARKRFGDDSRQWRFVCPSCGHVASVQDWHDAGAPEGAVAYSCVGRWIGGDDAKTFKRDGGPCTYAGGGLFGLNPLRIVPSDHPAYDVFALADVATVTDRARGA